MPQNKLPEENITWLRIVKIEEDIVERKNNRESLTIHIREKIKSILNDELSTQRRELRERVELIFKESEKYYKNTGERYHEGAMDGLNEVLELLEEPK